MSKKKQYTFSSLLFLLLLVMPLHAWAQGVGGCDAGFVTLGDKAIEVTPTGVDDTDNIQCALEAVKTLHGGTPGVRLSAGDFFISSIMVENYKGYLQGETRDTTSLVVLNGSVNCAAMHSAGQAASALKFIKGEPVVRFMTIELGITSATSKPTAIKGKRGDKTKPQAVQIVSPCLDSSTPLDSFINFTGKPADDPSCGNDVIFGWLDRVNLFGGGRGAELVFMGILAAPEGNMFGGCKNTLLGKLTVNQSWIGNFDSGVFTVMRAGAHVDVTFNTFWDNSYGVFITNSNQTTTVSNNIFDVLDTGPDFYAAGVYVTALSRDAPRETTVVISRNDFLMIDNDNNTMDAIGMYNSDGDAPPQDVGVFAANNELHIEGEDTAGMWFDTVNNGTVSGNRFSGDGLVGVEILTDGPTMSGWTFTRNGDMQDLNPIDADVWIGPGVDGTFIGPDQYPTLHDEGSNTIIPDPFPIDQPISLQGTNQKVSPLKMRNHSTKFLEMLKKR